MASIYALKRRFQALLRPTVRRLHRFGVRANQVTLAAALVSFLVATVVWLWAPSRPLLYGLLPLWMGLRMALNAVDGMLAREFDQQTRLGAYLNEICDVVADAALYLSLASVPGLAPGWLWLMIGLAALTEYAGVLGLMVGASRRYDGPMGKSDRAFVVGVLGALLAAGWIGATAVRWVAIAVAALCAITVWRRVRAGLAEPGGATAEPAAPGDGGQSRGASAPRGDGASMTDRDEHERELITFDGERLFYRHWPAEEPSRGAIVLLHRGHEHSGRIAHLADELDLPDFDVFAWDARGNGRSPGSRGDAPDFTALVRDLDCFVAHIGAEHGVAARDCAVVAQSVGAVIAATWVHDYAPRIRALVLASPAFDVKLYVPLARPAIALAHRVFGNFFINSYVKPQFLTHDPERIASFRDDPLITRPISARVLLGLYSTSERVVADANAITVPTQLLVSGSDFVVRRGPQDRFFERLGSLLKERHLLPGFFHDTLGERDREPAVSKVRGFVLARFAEPLKLPSLIDAHRHGATFDEAQVLAWPPERWSLQALRWRLVRASMRLGGALSEGIRVGVDTGFDSGSSLDYVYENEPRGKGPIGRLIDKVYINSIGWRGIRVRRTHLHELLGEAMERLRGADRPVDALDVAAGHGRYVLEALASGEVRADSIRLRDFSELNVEKGRALIEQLDASELARFDRGDAFDGAALAATDPAPTLAVVSGLYELFADNEMVLTSLKGLGAAVPEGGYLVYTGQPWHPQLELIARGLTSHRDGVAWVMRRRTQAEMDELVRAAGFRKVTQRIDRWGIFTVTLAERVTE